MQILQAVQAVKTLRDSRLRRPMAIKESLTFFGQYDLWHYISISDDRRCKWCEAYDGKEFVGRQIRTIFPDLEIRSPNIIDPHVHTTLWGKQTCRCKLVRVLLDPYVIPVAQFLSEEKLEETKVKPYTPKKKES
jgi:hypothetical protein